MCMLVSEYVWRIGERSCKVKAYDESDIGDKYN